MAATKKGQLLKVPRKPPFYRKTALRFHCTGCGKCCQGDPRSHYIAASEKELKIIQLHLALSRNRFLRTYTELLPWGDRGIRLDENGTCPFLVDAQCSIYRQRPAQCRSYPFWPEVVERYKDWQSEARRCEGINQGEIIPLEQIELRLKQSSD
ncbi:MAG: YkgJ family cysteine cluster protein [Acidiferrobacterales bacterium]